ncbi:OB-fold domain-containing protein [Streptomyces sp. NPDC048680]|uniref:Zn-ribbon domain-containing OB-fold protein n=1 Tax=Streptomyces sp. NPDC048680 TaxID=3155492 RepID=UPI003448AB35
MLPSFDDAALRCDDTGVTLRASRCPSCDTVSFPSRERCVRCYTLAKPMDLPGRGVVASHCTATFPIAGAQPPVTIAQVRMDGCDVEVLGVGTSEVRIGDPVAVVPRVVGTEGARYTAYGFENRADHA